MATSKRKHQMKTEKSKQLREALRQKPPKKPRQHLAYLLATHRSPQEVRTDNILMTTKDPK